MEQSNGLIHKEDLVLLFGRRNFILKFTLHYNDNFLIILRDDTKADLFFHHSEILNLREPAQPNDRIKFGIGCNAKGLIAVEI